MMLNALIGLKKELDELKDKFSQFVDLAPTAVHTEATDDGFMQLYHDGKKVVDQDEPQVPGYPKANVRPHIQDTEEFVEESLSIEEKEMELINKALERHSGKRKLAAEELGISERTLYRKIKEYNITQK